MNKSNSTKTSELRRRRDAPLATPTDLSRSATKDIAGAMNAILADVFALYLKTKNFHWHMSGPHFRDYHLLLDEQADQLFAMTDPVAERVPPQEIPAEKAFIPPPPERPVARAPRMPRIEDLPILGENFRDQGTIIHVNKLGLLAGVW